MSDRGLHGLGGAHAEALVERWRDGECSSGTEDVAEEVPVAFVYNGEPFAVMLASPLDLEDFALGFSITEGIIESVAEFQGIEILPESQGYSVYVSVPKSRTASLAKRRKNLAGRTGCGLCGAQMLEDAVRPTPIVVSDRRFTPEALQAAIATLATGQQLNALTGAVHAAAWAEADGSVRLVREDVGRHNALDKLIGALLQTGVSPDAGFAVITSRASYEMVHKTAVVGIPLLVAVSAPTALAIRVAAASRLTLAGFARRGRHTLYATPERLVS